MRGVFRGMRARCPFCGGIFEVGYVGSDPAVIHTLPMCAPYERLEIVDFISAVRSTLSIDLTKPGEGGPPS